MITSRIARIDDDETAWYTVIASFVQRLLQLWYIQGPVIVFIKVIWNLNVFKTSKRVKVWTVWNIVTYSWTDTIVTELFNKKHLT